MSYADIPGFMAPEYEDFYRVVAERLDENAKIVEVGCAYGRSIAFLVEAFIARGKGVPTIFAVDTWQDFMGCERDDWIGRAARDAKEHYARSEQAFLGMLKKHCRSAWERVTPMKMSSLLGAQSFAAHELDLVFIDANHTYESTRDDIIAWSPNVRVGGLLAGDDYDANEFPGVVSAVDQMVKSRAVGTFVTRGRVWIHEVK